MYLYEELELNALLDDPEIDPDSPEALYAAAQCHRLGKGTPVNEALYEDTLRLAAKAGSEAAQKELAVQKAQQAQTARPEQAAPRAMFESFRLADAGDPTAILEMVRYCREHSSAKDECGYLQRAAGQAAQGAYSAQQGQEIYIRLGELYAEQPLENPKESCRCYGMASELGSVAAMLTLADFSDRGYGCEKSAEQARAWMLRAAERGTPEVKCAVAMELGTEDRLRAQALLDEVAHTAPDEAMRARARLLIDLLGANHTWTPELLERAWPLREDPAIAPVLTEHYLAVISPQKPGADTETDTVKIYRECTADLDPEYLSITSREDEAHWAGVLRVKPEWADWLWRQPMKDSARRLWAAAARDLGSGDAEKYLTLDTTVGAVFQNAQQCARENNWEQAGKLYRDAAEYGSGAAAYHYAMDCLPDLPKYRQERQTWLRRAAGLDSVQAMEQVCQEPDGAWALERLAALAEKGYAVAQAAMGRYCGGFTSEQQLNGIPVGKTCAASWFRKAVAPRGGETSALKEIDPYQYICTKIDLVKFYFDNRTDRNTQTFFLDSIDPEKDFSFAQETYAEFLRYRCAFIEPVPTGISYLMGQYYERGIGTQADFAKAAEIYRDADSRYDGETGLAWSRLSAYCLDGTGVAPSLIEARRWLDLARDAVKSGHPMVYLTDSEIRLERAEAEALALPQRIL